MELAFAAWRPVSNDHRAGVHSGAVVKAWSNVTPSALSASRCGVRRCGAPYAVCAARGTSSSTMSRMSCGRLRIRVGLPAGLTSSAYVAQEGGADDLLAMMSAVSAFLQERSARFRNLDMH